MSRKETASLLELIPKNRRSVLDIGARDGYFSKLLTQYFVEVVALDLSTPTFECPGIKAVAGDVTRLEFPDSSFDCVFCAEVLEHIPDLAGACREIVRVARHEIVIGVPFRQDLRFCRTTCQRCGKASPPWGHINRFDQRTFAPLFPGLQVQTTAFVGSWKTATNFLSAALMDLARNPWGPYNQNEPCIHCGAPLGPPSAERSMFSKAASAGAHYLTMFQQRLVAPVPKWIHIRFAKSRFTEPSGNRRPVPPG